MRSHGKIVGCTEKQFQGQVPEILISYPHTKVSFEGKNMTQKPFISVPTMIEKWVKHFPKPVTSGNADEMKDL